MACSDSPRRAGDASPAPAPPPPVDAAPAVPDAPPPRPELARLDAVAAWIGENGCPPRVLGSSFREAALMCQAVAAAALTSAALDDPARVASALERIDVL